MANRMEPRELGEVSQIRGGVMGGFLGEMSHVY